MHLLWTAFIKNNDSSTQTCEFRKHFNIGRNGRAPKHQTILNWVSQFKSIASALLKKNPGCPQPMSNPENVVRVRVTLQHSPQLSARHSVALGMSDMSVRRMLHMDFRFHPFKIQVVQELLP
jgi:hypothetical protein